MTHKIEKEFESYFWLYAPSGDIIPKKIKRAGQLPGVFAAQVQGNNPLAQKLCDEDHVYAPETRHLTLFEQPRTATEVGQFRYQPIGNMETLLEAVNTIQDVATDYMPLELGGKSLELIEKTNKVHLALSFNAEAVKKFDEFYDDLMAELDELKLFDLYTEPRKPRVFLSKAYKSEFKNVDIKAARKSFNDSFEKFKTKPVTFDRLVLGQGLYDIHGKNLARRDVATIHFDGRPFEWHCDDPYSRWDNVRLIAKTAHVREQGRVDGQSRPSLVA